MFIVVMSDIHRAVTRATEIVKRCRRADLFICLGDGSDSFISVCNDLHVPHTEVCGNCDIFLVNKNVPNDLFLDLAGKKIFGCHGHRYGVKHDLDYLTRAALERDADIALFGHTHMPHSEYVQRPGKDPLLLLNPGSVYEGGCFATLDIREKYVVPNLTKL